MRPKPETGNRYGRLVVVSPDPVGKTRLGAIWECVCDCGEVVEVLGVSLRADTVKSCGCLRRQRPGNNPNAARALREMWARRHRYQRILDNTPDDPDALLAEDFGL